MKCEDVETSPVKLGNPEQPPLQNIQQVACYSSHMLSHYIYEWASQRGIRADKLTPTTSDRGETEAQDGCMTHSRSLNLGFQYLSFNPALHTSLSCNMIYPHLRMGFPGGINGKESVCQQRCKRHGFDPWVEKMPWRRKWQPPPVFLPGKSMGAGTWRATGHGSAKSGTWLKHSCNLHT